MDSSHDISEMRRVLAETTVNYRERGFARRIGFGSLPALLIIDLGYAWTKPDKPFSCGNMDEIIDGVKQLLDQFRKSGYPVVYTTTAYELTSGENLRDSALWHRKLPVEDLVQGSHDVAIDTRIEPSRGELVLTKTMASAFYGTPLSGILNSHGVDTLIVTGVSAGGCVRHTVEDALAFGFRPIVVEECIGDHMPGSLEWNLFEIDNRFGDVEPLGRVLEEVRRLSIP